MMSIPDHTMRRYVIKSAIAASAAFAIGIVACDRVTPDPQIRSDTVSLGQSQAAGRSIAVLPFANIGDDPENGYFSDGLAEELLNLLSEIDRLRVTARTSSFSFKDKDVDISSIGKTLNVANILEGSVGKSGNGIRITAKLVNTDDGSTLWSETYERNVDGVFAIQDDIAKAVVDALQVSIVGDMPTVRQTDPEAYAAYLRALHLYRQRTPDGYEKTVTELQQALDIDRNYAPAWSLLSSTYTNMALVGLMAFDEAYDRALQAVETALELDPDYPMANSTRAFMAMTSESDYPSAAKFFKRALGLSPGNSDIIGDAAVLARTLGFADRAIAMTEHSLVLDPVSASGYINLSDQLYRADRPQDAAIAARKALDLAPGSDTARANLALAHLLAKEPQQALEDIAPVEGEFVEALVKSLAYASLGDTESADMNLDTLIVNYWDSSAIYIASIYAWRGDIEPAFEWLEQGIVEQQPMPGIRTDPFLRNLYDDERWDSVLRRVGLSDQQVAAIDF